jgi:hypothetical protein
VPGQQSKGDNQGGGHGTSANGEDRGQGKPDHPRSRGFSERGRKLGNNILSGLWRLNHGGLRSEKAKSDTLTFSRSSLLYKPTPQKLAKVELSERGAFAP